MKLLNGRELAGFVKERQMHEVRSLKQSAHVEPRLAIIRTNRDEVADSYMRQKQRYGDDIGVAVDVHTLEQDKAIESIVELNANPDVHGIIVQIPVPDPAQTDKILSAVIAQKDVDGLAAKTMFDPATPIAINWLLAGYNIDLTGKHLVIVGHGRLVGRPLARMWRDSGLDVEVADSKTLDLKAVTLTADVLICATGAAGLITPDMVKSNAVIVDAGVATDSSGLVGDVNQAVRELPDIIITPEKGGVGPLTVCALFDNVLRAARS